MWSELVARRGRGSRVWQDSDNPRRHVAEAACGAAWHYASDPDSTTLDATVDMTPQRVINAQLDGWTITQAGWHYALGRPAGASDGWVGFGGRRGQNWFRFRLARVGYLRWNTRAWQDVGGTPAYDRAALSMEQQTVAVGPNAEELTPGVNVHWGDIWTTPGGGELSLDWRADGTQLKEIVRINAAGRGWITANRPPTTPATQTWFGFVFQVDWSDILRRIVNGLLSGADDDVSTDGDIELRDAADRLLGLLPMGYVWAEGNEAGRLPLRRRVWHDQDGNYYLLVGVRCDLLNNMPGGDLLFDPTIDEQIGGQNLAGRNYSNCTLLEVKNSALYLGGDGGAHNGYWQFTTVNVPAGSTIDVAYARGRAFYQANVTSTRFKARLNDADSSALPTTCALAQAKARTAGVDWDPSVWAFATWYNSPSLVNDVQAVIDRGGWVANNNMMLIIDDDGSAADAYVGWFGYDDGASSAMILHIEYTEPSGSDDLAADDLVTGAPDLGTPALGQVHDLTVAALTAGAPSLGAPALGQIHDLTADAPTTGAPVLGEPVLGHVHVLTADGIVMGAPALGTPALGQVHDLVATGLTATPVLGEPALVQVHDLTADAPTTGAPVLGTPAIGQGHALIASMTIGAPSLGTPALGQVHALAVIALAVGAPSLGTPAIGQAHALTATGIAAGAPSLGTPTAGQAHALIAEAIAMGAPALDEPAIGQVHALAATPVATGTPTVGTPAMGQIHALTADDLAAGALIVGTPAAAQAHALVATGITAGAPAVGTPNIGQVHALTAGLTIGAPSLGAPALGQVHALVASGLTCGAPVLGTPALDSEVGTHALTASALILGAPVLDSPALRQAHVLIATAPTTGPPTLGTPALGQVWPTSAERIFTVGIEDRTFEVDSESRTMTVAAETRTYTVED